METKHKQEEDAMKETKKEKTELTALNLVWYLFVCFLAALGLAFVVLTFTGCGNGDDGHDDDNDCAVMGSCPDAGPMTTDADPTAPDADMTPDAANNDPCAPYYPDPDNDWTQGWRCEENRIWCDFLLQSGGGQCYIVCLDGFSCLAREDMITSHYFTCLPTGGYREWSCYN